MKPNLKIRIRTAVVFAIIMLVGIIAHRYAAIALLLVIGIGCLYEYTRITRSDQKTWRHLRWYTGLAAIALAVWCPPRGLPGLALLAALFGLVGIVNMYSRRPIINHDTKGSLVSLLYIGLPIGLLIRYLLQMEAYTPLTLLSIFGFIWMSDSAAYLVGSQIGRRKLFPRISPNKTWEGTLGAGLFTVVLGLVFAQYLTSYSTLAWCLAALVIWLWGSYGDLVESSLKRQYQIKDSGHFMPGHGGFLDRFDSFLYVIPPVLLLHYLAG